MFPGAVFDCFASCGLRSVGFVHILIGARKRAHYQAMHIPEVSQIGVCISFIGSVSARIERLCTADMHTAVEICTLPWWVSVA